MKISILSNEQHLEAILHQFDLPGEILIYKQLDKLRANLNFNDINLVIIDDSCKSAKVIDFIKHYRYLVNIVYLGNLAQHFPQVLTLAKPVKIEELHNVFRIPYKPIYSIEDELFHLPHLRMVIKILDRAETKMIELTEKENDLLNFIRTNKNYSKEQLLQEVFGYKDASSTHTVESHIHRLRSKISEDFMRDQKVIQDDQTPNAQTH